MKTRGFTDPGFALIPVNPAISTSSVEAKEACDARSVGSKTVFSGGGNRNPRVEWKGSSPGGGKSRRPHQRRVEDRVRDRWRASLVARAVTVRPYDVVVIDADRDRLRIAESVGGPVTAGARVVAVQTEDLVEEEQPPELDLAGIELATEPGLERGVDSAGKASLPQDMLKLAV